MGASCHDSITLPDAPLHATHLNGIALPEVCFRRDGPHHVFVIGDWGGVGVPPKPADRRGPTFKNSQRKFVVGADDCAQQRVAEQMQRLAANGSSPDYVVNVGDNFYWGGIREKCGKPPFACVDSTGQWKGIFESIYKGPGLDGKPWLGVLGNHDYGGYVFTGAWDQAIGYTWTRGFPSTHRWVTPAQYYSQRVQYPGFSVDYFFLDTNVFDAYEPQSDPKHNICSRAHNEDGAAATCGAQGPTSVEHCPEWFHKLWEEEQRWLERGLSESSTHWQIVVTHFPPEHGKAIWTRLAREYGIDLIISGHVHRQEVYHAGPENFLWPTAYVVSGGGGGITSESAPDPEGHDDQYGFMDLTLSRDAIEIAAISHGGQVRSSTRVTPRPAAQSLRYV